MKLIRKLAVRATVLAIICYPLMWVAAWALDRDPLAPCVVAAAATIATIVVSDDLDSEKG
mgnify:CR=1 FL=1